jgi:outer membrane protein assembly factor BamB
MTMKLARLIPLGCLAALATSLCCAAGGDWPQWRGPDRTDLSRETGLLKTWPEGGPKRVWLFEDAGLGYSGPAIAGGKLFTMGIRDGAEHLLAVDTKDGKLLWSVKIDEVLKNGWGDGPRGTPAVDGETIYTLSGRGMLVCANVVNGRIVWQHAMREYGGKTPNWGYTESVLVDGDKVVCTPGGPQGALIALDKKTGKTIWQSKEFTDPAHYSSVIAVNHAGKRQYVQLTEKHVVGISAADGATLWTSPWPGRTAVIPTPIFHDGHVYVTSGYDAGCKLIKLGPDNEATDVYSNKEMVNHHGGVILVGEHLYGHSDRSGWTCQKFQTGEQVWAEKTALGKGSIAYADGMLYCLAERDGTLALIEASPKGWSEKSRFKLQAQSAQRNPKGRIWTHPVIAGGRLYLRDQEFLSCYDVKAP